MTSWVHDPDAAASSLIMSVVDELDFGDRILLCAPDLNLLKRLNSRGAASQWDRRVQSSGLVSADPPTGPFASVLLRLPKSRDEQIMTAHQCLAVLEQGGCLYVYGGNTEGIRTFQKVLSVLGPIETVAARGHGRILSLRRADVVGPLRGLHADWRQVLNNPPGWITYPGLFAAGTPDAGTVLLIEHLPDIAEGARVLDYGSGPGAISVGVLRRQPTARLTLVDNDSIALVAARENVTGVEFLLGANLDAVRSTEFDLVVSNPPLHAGFRDDLSPLHALIKGAPLVLTATGLLLLVVQRRIALDRALAKSFAEVNVLADDGRYRVWCASGRGAKQRQSLPRRSL